MSKTSDKRAIKALPKLRASLIWFKRETVRELRRRASEARSVKMSEYLFDKARKVARLELAELRVSYEVARVSDIRQAPLFELERVVPGLVRMSINQNGSARL